MSLSEVTARFAGEAAAPWLAPLIGVALVVGSAALAFMLTRRVLIVAIRRLAARSATTWDDELVREEVFARFAHIVPAFVVYYGIQLIEGLPATAELLFQHLSISIMVIMLTLAVGGFLSAVNSIWSANPENRHRPIKGYLQIVKLVVYLTSGLLVLSTMLDKSPWIFLSGLGALAAVLLLIFKDTILSLVASVQLTGNDMIHVGDWIEMPKYGADGDVVDIALHTVKVQNWDKTITTIPTYRLIEDSFKNWRGMSSAGARRIKRSIAIDVASVRFLTDEEIARAGHIGVLTEYIATKRSEISEHNQALGADSGVIADQRRLTNLGTLRAYIVHYLRNHSGIHQGMTLLVRQLQPGPEGVPIEIYTFTNTTVWAEYEDIQADLFDHLYAILPEFGLRAFQSPTGHDVGKIGEAVH